MTVTGVGKPQARVIDVAGVLPSVIVAWVWLDQVNEVSQEDSSGPCTAGLQGASW